jgi:hypothetical protein
MCGLCATFVLRTAATFSTELFTSPLVAQAAVWTHLISAATMVWFFLAFLSDLSEVTSSEPPPLRRATATAAAGAAMALLVPLQTVLRISDIAPFSAFVRSPWLEPIAPLIATVAILIFFAAYRRELVKPEDARLQGATSAAMWAYALFTVLNLVVLALYMGSGELRWLTQMGPAIAWITLPLVAAGFAAVLYFYWTLSKYLARP